ncbi:MAG: glycosyltransferase family 4 protein [Candidatus Nanohaloarchaea archaeon]
MSERDITVGLVCFRADNALGSGSERYAYRLKQFLEEAGIEVKTIETDYRYPVLNRTLYSMIDVRRKVKALDEEVDIFHGVIPQEAIPSGSTDTPFIVTWHDIIQLVTKKSGNSWKGRLFAKYFYTKATNADHIISISKQTTNMIQSYYGLEDDRITTIPHGINEKFTPSENRDYSVDGEFVFGYLGALNERKRVDYLIESFGRFKEKGGENAILKIYGKKGYKYEELVEQVKNDPRIERDEVSFEGFVPEDEIVETYNEIDTFLFSSEREGWGYPPSEAMKCGTPVIIRDGCIPSEVKEPAIKARNPTEMAEKMKEIQSDQELRQDVAKHQLDHINQYTWDKNIRKVIETYERVLNG